MNDTALVAIALTDRERDFIRTALVQWGGPASWVPLPIGALGIAD